MRVKVQQGSASIEVEGEFSEVEKILGAWWHPDSSNSGDGDDSPHGSDSAKIDKPPPRRTTPRRPRPAERPRVEDGFDAQTIVNRMREDERFEKFRAKIILGKATRVNCTKFVSWYLHDTPLTAFNISAVLMALGVRWDSQSIAKALAAARDDYIKDPNASPITYRLTARGQADFEAWMQNGD